MKKNLFLLIGFILLGLNATAQGKANLILFSEDGDKFYAYVNGIRQNDKPDANVKITGLSPNVSVRIEFEDKALPQLKQNMYLEGGMEHTAKIMRDMKKQMKLRYFGQNPIGSENTSAISTVEYHTAETTPIETVNVNSNASSSNGNTSITTTTTSTTIKNNTNGNSDNVALNINMGGVGLNMNVSGMGGMETTGGTMNTTTSTTVTSSSSSSGSMSNNDQAAAPTKNQTTAAPANTGCSIAMNSANFDKMKQSIESKPFSETKMSTAKVATKNACLSVSQVKIICALFSMDDDKLTYAKYAYDRCVDKANYYQVSDVFSFSATTEEFNKFLEQ